MNSPMITTLQAITLVVPDLDRCLGAYRATLGYVQLEQSRVAASEAREWGAPLASGSRSALLRAPAGPPVMLRLIERPTSTHFDPLRCHGWYANEILVENPSALCERLKRADSGFRVVGEPAPLASNPQIVALQALGPAGELLYFTQLPPEGGTFIRRSARAAVDGTFIVVLAGPELEALQQFHRERWTIAVTDRFEGVVGPANTAFERPADALTPMALAPISSDFAIELDQLPSAATPKPSPSDDLPIGWSMLTVRVDRWPNGAWRVSPRLRKSGAYAGEWSGVLVGPAGEWWEVVGPAAGSTRIQAT